MKKLDYGKLNNFIASDVIQPFYQIRLNRLTKLRLLDIAKRKNPYLFKAKNIETAGDLAKKYFGCFSFFSRRNYFWRFNGKFGNTCLP